MTLLTPSTFGQKTSMCLSFNLVSGDLLQADVEALVNPVNCVGVMGKGLALQFKQAYPVNYQEYAAACKRGLVQPGTMFVTETAVPDGPRYIINFPTKRHWREMSRLEDIEQGLSALVATVRERQISSVALPALGCGLGGLDWGLVRSRIEAAFATLQNVHVWLYVS